MFKLISIFLSLFIISSSAMANGWVVIQGTITQVTNTSNNLDRFTIVVDGGSQHICPGQSILFPIEDAGNAEVHKRAYSTALTALTTGIKASVYNYHDNTCNRASYIQLDK